MTHVAYEWGGDVFCEEDIIAAMTDHAPWSEWISAGHEPTEGGADIDLRSIALYFMIDTDDEAETRKVGWPVKLDDLPDPPEICSGCLRWFT